MKIHDVNEELVDTKVIHMADGDVIYKKSKRKKNKFPKEFTGIGMIINKNSKHCKNTTDIFNILVQINSIAVMRVFNDLKNNRDPDNNHTVSPVIGLSKHQIHDLNKHLVILRKYKIIKKIKKRVFMFNPALIMCWDYDEAKIEWSKLK